MSRISNAIIARNEMAEPTLAEKILSDVKDDPSILSDAEKVDDTEAPAKVEDVKVDTAPPEGADADVQPATTDVPTNDADNRAAPQDEKPPDVNDQIKVLTDTVKDLAATVAALKTPNNQPAAAQPTISPDQSNDLLSNVYDEQSLQRAEKDLESLVEFAETHRDGAYDYEVTDAKGNVTKKDFTPEQVTNIKLRAETALRAIPKRREYIQLRGRFDSAAVETYPDLGKQDSAWRKEAAQMLAAVPQLANIPDFMFWIGHALRGRDIFLKEQAGKKNGKTSDAIERIQKAPKEVAPAVVNSRGTVSRTEAQKKADAQKRLSTEHSEEAAEAYLESIGI